jgi:hypothetical protein
MCGPEQPQQIVVFLFWPLCRPSLCVESVPERLRDSDRFLVQSTVGVVKFGLGCIVSYWSLDWPDRTVGLGPDRTGLILVRSGPKVKDRTVKQSPYLVRTGLKLL